MGKIFVTDEVNDNYTAQVTRGGKVKVETGAASFKFCTSAHGLVCAENVVQSPAWLKSIIIGGTVPPTATTLTIFNTTECSTLSGFGSSGDNIVGILVLDSSASISGGVQAGYPKTIPFNVYCSSGISVGVGLTACCIGQNAGRLGAIPAGYTVVYQA